MHAAGDVGETKIFPEPEGEDAEDGVDDSDKRKRVENADETDVDAFDELAERRFRDPRGEDLGVEVGECGDAV